MSELARRLVPACFLALVLHAVVLAWRVRQEPLPLPAPLAVQRIAVSLGARSVAREPPPKSEQEAKHEKEVIPQPEPNPSKPRPIVKLVAQPMAKPEPAKEQQAVSPPEPVKLPMDTPIVPEEEPPLLHTEIGDKSTKAEIAAHVIQQAAPLYQVNSPPKYPRLARRHGLEGACRT
jgi:outer membrane biosynthesis protein TonB